MNRRSPEATGGELRLVHSLGVVSDGKLIRSETITTPWGNREEDKGKQGTLKKTVTSGATLTQHYNDRDIAEQLLRTATPLTIRGDDRRSPLVLAAKLHRLTYKNSEGDRYEIFVVKLAPTDGAIAEITENKPSLGTYGINHQPRRTVITTADKRIRIEVNRRPF